MRTIIAIACLGLLMWAETASAQSPYSLKVSRHPTVMGMMSQSEIDRKVDDILSDASKILRNNSAHACNVTFRRNGPVETFTSPSAPAIIRPHSPADRDAVHSEDSDIKIVKEIRSCRSDDPTKRDGCAWPPEARGGKISIIVVETPGDAIPNIGRLWAHELGHRMGLRHMKSRRALMTGCDFSREARISKRDCDCFLMGPQSCERTDRQCP
jgi:hypothetical protein